MRPKIRSKGVFFVFALLVLPQVTAGQGAPKVRATSGFRLFARAYDSLAVNNVFCGIVAGGELCRSVPNSTTIGGGYWPKNSPQQYIFNSGLQVAGAIDTAGGWAWAGDTTGGFFFDPKGTTEHGEEVDPIWNYANAADRANWPAAAYVPEGDSSAAFFDPALRGRPSASEGDVWTLAWEGDPARSAGRPHPLGIAVETRGLGWNYPAGNGDIIYFVHTFYNVSSTCAADYAAIRPAMREKLLSLGQQFQTLNNTKFGIQIPACGYRIKDLYLSLAADPDVSSDGGNNYSAVNPPLQLAYTYEDTFRRTEGNYVLPGGLGDAPFIGGYGFVGFKYLHTPAVGGVEAGVRLYSSVTGGSAFNDPQNVSQLFRYLSGHLDPALGDGVCNYSPATDHICYIKYDGHADSRQFQSTGPADLPPGRSVTIVTAYVFASPVAIATCAAPGCPSVLPGDPRWLSDPAQLTSAGANRVDSIAGYRGYVDVNGDGKVQGREFRAVRGSLIQKAQLAQAIFDDHFLLPSAPESPAFFLVPGNDQVGIFWRPSATESAGDPFFFTASSPANPAYDPNFRQFDVEGYRIYRGRVDDPNALTLLAQFDYAGTTMRDYLGVVDARPGCAPELGLSSTPACPVNFSTPSPGNPFTTYATYGIGLDPTGAASPFVQVRLGDRFLKATGQAFVTVADTAITGGASGRPELIDTGVPFVFLDHGVKNNLRYFYAVTAFDVNSIQSGPSSLESARITKSATPVAPGSNYDNKGTLTTGIFGRGVNMSGVITQAPRIDDSTGVFSGPARPATGAQLGFMGDLIVQVVTQSGESSLRLDSMLVGSDYESVAGTGPNIPNTYYFSLITPSGTVKLTQPVFQDPTGAEQGLTGMLDGPPVDTAAAQRYGGDGGYRYSFAYQLSYPGTYYTMAYGRGCTNSATGFTFGRCAYNGARWFSGATESFAHPTRGNGPNGAAGTITDPTNAGSLPGVANIQEPRAYQTRPSTYRNVEGVLGGAATAADYKVYWGAGGTPDSVIDVTHNVPVLFSPDIRHGYTWGFLTQGAATVGGYSNDGRAELTVSDFGCVSPLDSFPAPAGSNGLGCGGLGRTYQFVNSVAFGPIAFANNLANDKTAPVAAHPGFGMYLAGHIFLFEMASAAPTAPAAGTVWTMRSYTGAISGGGGTVGTAGNLGGYNFVPVPSPLAAVGASLTGKYTITNSVHAATRADLDRVHTIPDPYYATNAFETDPAHKVIKFVNLPSAAVIRIYTTSGILVRVIEHRSVQNGGEEEWDVRNRDGRLAASGVYFYHIEAGDRRRVGRMTIVTAGR